MTAVAQVSQDVTTGGAAVAYSAYGLLIIMGIMSLLIMITEYVLTGIWLGQARSNADRIAPDQQRRSKIWVWLGWVVPVVSFWFPKQVIDDVWRSTVRGPSEPRTGWWWGTWIAATLMSWLGGNLIGLTTSAGLAAYWLSAVAMTVALVFWVRVVRTISDAQDALAGAA